MSAPERKLRVLCDLRPALDGHSGIPQASRLLFKELAGIPSLKVEGLLQHGTHLLAPGLPSEVKNIDRLLSAHQEIHRLGRVVISIEEQRYPSYIQPTIHILGMSLAQPFGKTHKLTRLDGSSFPDYLWQRLFAKSLLPQDFDIVVNCGYRVLRAPWHALHLAGLWTRWLGSAKYPRIDTREIDVLISETPFPGIVSKGTQLIVRYHDATPLTMPHSVKNRQYHQAAHYNALKSNIKNGAWFACVSDSTRNTLVSLFPAAAPRAVTIRNTISDNFFTEDSDSSRTLEIARLRASHFMRSLTSRRLVRWLSRSKPNRAFDFLLTVSTLEPRKNYLALLSAWEQLRANGFPELKLIIVGERGWHSDAILQSFRPWMECAALFHLEDVPPPELRLLYRHARVTVCPSLEEGFGYSGVEAIACGGLVVASEIAAHREIYRHNATYFNPHDPSEIATCIKDTIRLAPPQRYTAPPNDAPALSWNSLIERVQTARP